MAEQIHDDKLFQLLEDLTNASVKFVVCGGVACVLHGVERSTYDLDVAVDLDVENLKRIIKIAGKYKLVPRIPEPVANLLNKEKRDEWIKNKGAIVYTFVSEMSPLQIDIFLKYPIDFEKLYKNSDKVKIGETEFLVSSKEDLVYAKKKIEPVRDKDLIDIKELEKLILNEKSSKEN
jgi:hypothetical protein